MNNETNKLIEQLAQKLGTTTEYLWSVLIKQAHIQATTTLVQIIIIMLAGVFLYKIHRRLSDDNRETSYYNIDELIGVMVVATIIWSVLTIFCFFCISDVVNGYFNPEFWALQHVLSAIN